MANIYSNWKAFFESLDSFEEIIAPAAKKCGISQGNALALLALNENISLQTKFCENQLAELSEKGMLKSENGSFVLSAKGRIVARSLNDYFSKC